MEKKRFLFDIHNFDESAVVKKAVVEEYVPPAPTYSEDELKAAQESVREDAFRKGKQEGFRESEEGFSQKIYQVCQGLSENIKELLEAEGARNDLFQQECYTLVKDALEAALPDLMKRGDFDACLALISQALENYKHDAVLTLSVSEDYIEPLKTYFENNLENYQAQIKFVASKDGEKDALTPLNITWEHGGAVRDPEALKENILKVLTQALAEKALTPQNEDSNKRETDDE